ncbi:DUF4333 domain-containing protein [Mycobacterium sp. ITM-2016-00318]|uniref:DUF4333 domain-containing protein n=1 Tax=Mycobacterium sp. ITM-2016-00318 TaxID=2099693 RepID=UPI000CF97D94|nr:DUF4333 domain-containing protein [Mycobacterium sp. ITM-2016-00318]WNG94662.1 DUF4333 domain-containing protein [Mycobacterium sp. ITM-2016-00318]
MRRLLGSALWVAASAATVAACSFSAGTSVSVDNDELAKEISAQLEKQVGRAPESVECPDNLKGEVGATTRCTVNDAGDTYGVDVNVTKVEGTDVRFDLNFDDEPR